MAKITNLKHDYYKDNLESLFAPAVFPPIIYIEGAGGAGKSTAIEILKHNKFSLIGQYGTYLNTAAGEGFPPIPNTFDELIKADVFWLEMEARRVKDIWSKSGNGEPLLVERSYLSRFSFEYAMLKQGKYTHILHLAGNYSSLFELGLLPHPLGYVLLTATPDLLNQRVLSRNQFTPEFLTKKQTLSLIDTFFKKFLSTYVNPERYIIIDTSCTSPEEVASIIINFTNHMSKINIPDYGIRQFLLDIFKNTNYLGEF